MSDFTITQSPSGDFNVNTININANTSPALSRIVQVLVGPNILPVRQEWIDGRGWVTFGLPV